MKGIPPLTLQMIVENSIASNAFSKCTPLQLAIVVEGSDLVIRNTVQRKIGNELMDTESLLNNLVEKYQVLHQTPIRISNDEQNRIIRVPLITMKKKMAV
jgi:LytS/YehU family sensor histidine kinase